MKLLQEAPPSLSRTRQAPGNVSVLPPSLSVIGLLYNTEAHTLSYTMSSTSWINFSNSPFKSLSLRTDFLAEKHRKLIDCNRIIHRVYFNVFIKFLSLRKLRFRTNIPLRTLVSINSVLSVGFFFLTFLL